MLHLVQLLGWRELDQAVAGVAVGKQLSVVQQLPVEVVDVEGMVGGDADMRRTDELDRVVEVAHQRVQGRICPGKRDPRPRTPRGTCRDTSEYRKETDLGVGGGVAGDDGDGHGCSFRCGAGLLPGGGEVVGEVGGGVLQPQQVHRTRRGCGVRVPRRGV